jgi:Proteins containing SET domain
MYTQFLEKRPSTNGIGLFTKMEIPANVPIFEATGPIRLLEDLPDEVNDIVIQVGPNTFLGPAGELGDYINHSCNPNCRIHVVGNRAIFYSMYVIPKDSELTYDYSTTSTDSLEEWSIQCNCGDYNCRQIISGHQYLSDSKKQEYIKKNMLPLYILYPNMFPRKFKGTK